MQAQEVFVRCQAITTSMVLTHLYLTMDGCKPIGIPLDVNVKLLKLLEDEFKVIQGEIGGVPYKARFRSLMYVMVHTRVGLAYLVSMVSQFMSKVGSKHWSGVKRIMR